MEKLGIPEIQLKPTTLTFHGIVLGHSCTCNDPPFAKGRSPVYCAIPWISR
jgi:hypothetical protein